jgi:DNA-binding transcriptional regulator YhcF (GntR family)
LATDRLAIFPLIVMESRELIVDTMRGRVLRGLQAGTLAPGDRLPSSRELSAEFDVDHRVVIAAYRALASEGLVDMRPRGGVYVTGGPSISRRGLPPLPESWLVNFLTEGLGREIPGPELHEWLRRSVETLRLRAVAIASTLDQTSGLCRELRDDFGMDADGLLADVVRESEMSPLPLRRADLVVTTEAHAEWARALGADLRKPVIVIDVRPELLGGEWALLLRRPVYVVVATAEFGEMLRRFYARVPGIEHLRVIVFGRDDLTEIPEGAPTYVTQGVRTQLGDVRVPGRILPAARTISSDSARAIFAFIVRSNIEAMVQLDR